MGNYVWGRLSSLPSLADTIFAGLSYMLAQRTPCKVEQLNAESMGSETTVNTDASLIVYTQYVLTIRHMVT